MEGDGRGRNVKDMLHVDIWHWDRTTGWYVACCIPDVPANCSKSKCLLSLASIPSCIFFDNFWPRQTNTSIFPIYYMTNSVHQEFIHLKALFHYNQKHPHCHILLWHRLRLSNRGLRSREVEKSLFLVCGYTLWRGHWRGQYQYIQLLLKNLGDLRFQADTR